MSSRKCTLVQIIDRMLPWSTSGLFNQIQWIVNDAEDVGIFWRVTWQQRDKWRQAIDDKRKFARVDTDISNNCFNAKIRFIGDKIIEHRHNIKAFLNQIDNFNNVALQESKVMHLTTVVSWFEVLIVILWKCILLIGGLYQFSLTSWNNQTQRSIRPTVDTRKTFFP